MRVALTGAATGIGAGITFRLKRDGHDVTALDIPNPGENLDRWIEADLSDPDSISAAIDAAGPFDALINNAGLPPRDGQEELVPRSISLASEASSTECWTNFCPAPPS